ncbi:amidophosphoribosyltransferase [Mycoplasmatota bacterium zrk1]
MSELDSFLNDKLNEECGVFGVYNIQTASELTYYGLHSLQHRGQEGCGIVSSNGECLKSHKGEGLVTTIFNEQVLSNLKGVSAIGHVRYSTAGGGGIMNVQPFLFHHHTGDFALCHNGNIVNSSEIREFLEKQGTIFQSSSDTEILAHLVKKDTRLNRVDALKEALRLLEGAFAFLILTKDKLYVARDRHGLRPLSLGKINGGYVVSSESCAFNIVGGEFVRDVNPGEILVISESGIESHFYAEETKNMMCAMEYIYFSRPDSVIEGLNVHAARKESGKVLANEMPVEADIVIGVPDSSISAAIGYAEESKIPYEMGLIKNKYIARTFIQPTQELREKGVRMKLSAVDSLVKGKRVVLIDDSIVRGTTIKRIITLLREAGAKEIHVRIAAPAITHPCFYGVDTSTYDELISSRLGVEEVKDLIKADSLHFISSEGLKSSFNRDHLCLACFSGEYPTPTYKALDEANKDGKF